MAACQLYAEKNGERFLKSAHRFGYNAQHLSAYTAISRTRIAISHTRAAVLLIAVANGG